MGSLIWDGDWTGFAGVQGGQGFPAEPYKPVLYQGNNTQVSSAVQRAILVQGCEQVQGLGLHCQGRNFILSHLCLNRRARHSRTQTNLCLPMQRPPLAKPHCCHRAPGPTQPYLNTQK